MKDKNKHIRQQSGDTYLKPEIPAEKAWSEMKDMLDEQMPSIRSATFNWIKLIKLLLAVALFCAGLLYIYINDSDSIQNKMTTNIPGSVVTRTERETNKNDSKANSGVRSPVSSGETNEDVNNNVNKSGIQFKFAQTPSAINQKTSELISNKKNSTFKTQLKSNNETRIRPFLELPELTDRIPDIPLKNNIFETIDTNIQEPKLLNNSRPKTSLAEVDSGKGHPSKNKVSGNDTNHSGTQQIHNPKNRSTVIIKDRTVTVSKIPAMDSREISPFVISILEKRPFVVANKMESKLKALTFKSRQVIEAESKILPKGTEMLQNVHAGFLWNAAIPSSGYDTYFRGIDKTNDFYKILLPGIWIGKTFKNGSELLVKFKPYNQHFGNNTLDTSVTMKRDSAIYYYTTSRGLLKSSGSNLGLQYNYRIYNRLSIGVGTDIQWQKKALLSNQVKSSRRNSVVDYIPYVSLLQKVDTSGYLKPHFFTTNLEILYHWKKLQFVAGITLPVTSMISSQKKLRPVSGQVTVRWWVR